MSINELNGTFFIPAYQRGYRWTEEQVRQLLNDLFQFSNHHGEGEFYCLQPIIVKKRNENEWEVVDGQQRLTLFWLLKDISHIIDSVQNEIQYKLTFDQRSQLDRFLNEKLTFRDKEETTPGFLKNELVNLWNNRHADNDNIDSSDCIYLFKTLNTIIATKIANSQWYEIIRAIMANNITNAVKIIWYELDENENPNEMFSNINANRIRLTDSELIKAHLLHKIADDNRRKVISEKWSEIEKKLNDDKF